MKCGVHISEMKRPEMFLKHFCGICDTSLFNLQINYRNKLNGFCRHQYGNECESEL